MHASNVASRSDAEDAPTSRSGPARRGAATAALAFALALVLGACSNPLDVQNPNKLTEEDVSTPAAMSSLANGAIASVTRGVQAIGGVYLTATDEVFWIGSRDAWGQLDEGKVDNPTNEFADAAWPFVAEGRFMADRAISQGELFRSEGTLTNPTLLAQSYLAGTIIYTSIADMFDDYVLPDDPQEAAPPVGPENMDQLYDTAIGYATSGLEVARAQGDSELETRLLAMRARAHHAKAIWNEINPSPSPADPLVSSSSADADAAAVLDMVDDRWRFQLDLRSELVVGDLSFALQMNERGEIQVGSRYGTVDPDDRSQFEEVTLADPIDGAPDPVIVAKLAEFFPAGQFAPMTMTSAREMHLILAESELLNNGDTEVFRGHINAVRVLDELTPYDGQVPAQVILQHERRVNLFFMFRRLVDMYRFGVQDDLWQSTSTAVQEPGTMLPITITEILANPEVSG